MPRWRILPGFSVLRSIGLNPLTLSFKPGLETLFCDDYFGKSLPQVRMAIILGGILYGSFGFLDAVMVPELKYIFWGLRFGFVIPVLAVALALSYCRFFRVLFQPVMAGLMFMGGGVIIAMLALAGAPISYSYYAGLILIFIWGYTFIRLRFIWATLTALLIVLLYEVVAVSAGTPWPVLVNNNFFFISSNIIGMFACYSIEYYQRRDFYTNLLLEGEREKVKEANRHLEEKVEERTLRLKEKNTALQEEMAKRSRMEKEKADLEEKLARSEKMEAIGRLAGGVAHDLNNVLNAIVGYPDLMLMMLPEDSPHRTHIMTMQRSGIKAAAIVRDLLTLARRGVKVNEVLSLGDIVRDYLRSPEFKRMKVYHPNVRVSTEVAEGLWNIEGSPVHLSKMVMNLISNAAEAMTSGGEIRIRLYNKTPAGERDGRETLLDGGDQVVLEVADEGIGISPDDQKKIFEPFYTKKVMGRSGTGLGMAVVWGTVEDHDGTIDVVSGEGEGATFTVSIPRTIKAATRQAEEDPYDEYIGEGEKILVVDDLKEQRTLARIMLENLGYSVATAASGEDAVEYLRYNPVDLVLLDMIMDPGIDGLDTYRRILDLRPGTKAIIASGFSENERARETMRLGAGEYLMKPYTLRKIGAAVRAELGRDRDPRR